MVVVVVVVAYSLFRERNQGDICFINITFISDCLDNETLHCLGVTEQLLQAVSLLSDFQLVFF